MSYENYFMVHRFEEEVQVVFKKYIYSELKVLENMHEDYFSASCALRGLLTIMK